MRTIAKLAIFACAVVLGCKPSDECTNLIGGADNEGTSMMFEAASCSSGTKYEMKCARTRGGSVFTCECIENGTVRKTSTRPVPHAGGGWSSQDEIDDVNHTCGWKIRD